MQLGASALSPVAAGDLSVISYTLTYDVNSPPQQAVITVTLPAGASIQSCTPAEGGACTTAAGSTIVTVPPLTPFQSGLTVAQLLIKVGAHVGYSSQLYVSAMLNSELGAVGPLAVAVATGKDPNSFGGPASPPPPPASITLSAAALAFGKVDFGSNSSPMSLTITNNGSSMVWLSTEIYGNYRLNGMSCDDQRDVLGPLQGLPPGESCTVSVVSSPQQQGGSEGRLLLTEYDGYPANLVLGQQSVPLRTNVLAVISQPHVRFGVVPIGASFTSQAFLSNLGLRNVTIQSIALSGDPDFSFVADCTVVVPSSSCSVADVTFAPTAPVKRKATLTVVYDDPSSPATFSLEGSGSALQISTPQYSGQPIPLSPTVAFIFQGNLSIPTPSTPFTVTNSYSAPLIFNKIAATDSFVQSNDCMPALAPQSSCTIELAFQPRANGEFQGTLKVDAVDPAGPQVFALDGTGVGIKRQKIYVHYDYMVASDHTDDPEVVGPGSIETVINSFKAHGIDLIIDPNHTAIPEAPLIAFSLDCGNLPYFYDLRAQYYSPTRASEHYVIFGYEQSLDCKNPGPSGQAELPGRNLLVSLGREMQLGFTPAQMTLIVAGTFMHELGHNLGLHHGGLDDTNYKPNYLSIMNYLFQTAGVLQGTAAGSSTPAACATNADCANGAVCSAFRYCTRVDYSRQLLPTGGPEPGILDEANLDEHAGLGSGNADLTAFSTPDCTFQDPVPTQGPIDWNGDGVISTGIEANLTAASDPDLGGQCPFVQVFRKLRGNNDWAFLQPPSALPPVPTAPTTGDEAAFDPSSLRTSKVVP
jgi:hypothetical protein